MGIPTTTRQNGTLFLHIILANYNGDSMDPVGRYDLALTDYVIPKADTFNLRGDAVSKLDYL